MEERKKRGLFLGTLGSMVKAFFGGFFALWIVSSSATVQYVEFVRRIISGRRFFLTKMLASILYIFTPISFILVPLGLIVVIAAVFIAVDQTLVYDETVLPAFTNQVNNSLELGAKGALLFQASHHQLERMLNRFPYWSANDPVVYPQSWWDNSKNTQRGVWWATSETVRILSSKITRYGDGVDQNPQTLEATKNFNFGPDKWKWWVADSEGFFNAAISDLKTFEFQAKANSKLVNITTDDLKEILVYIKGVVLGEPYGRLTKRGAEIKQTELDDVVKFARGSAIVARDVLCVLRSSFTEELEKGGLDNLDEAIDSLEAVIDFHPWWVWRGDGDSMFADHRAKLSRYYSQAIRRIEDLIKSLKA